MAGAVPFVIPTSLCRDMQGHTDARPVSSSELLV